MRLEDGRAATQSTSGPITAGSRVWPTGVSWKTSSAPAAAARSRAARPKQTSITGSWVPWVIATGKPSRRPSESVKPATEGTKPLMASTPAAAGRSGPRVSAHAITQPCEKPPSTILPGGTPDSRASASSQVPSAAKLAVNVGGSGKPTRGTTYQ